MLNVFRLPKNQTLGSRTRSPLAVKYFSQTEDSRYTVFHSREHTDTEGVESGGGGCFRSSHLGVLKLMYRIIRFSGTGVKAGFWFPPQLPPKKLQLICLLL